MNTPAPLIYCHQCGRTPIVDWDLALLNGESNVCNDCSDDLLAELRAASAANPLTKAPLTRVMPEGTVEA